MKTPALQALRDRSVRAREHFLALQMRERWMLVVGATVLLATVLYLALFEPLLQARTQRATALESARQIAVRLEQAAVESRRASGHNPAATAGRGLSLMAAVDQASKQGTLGKSPTRIQPEGDREVRVWFEDVAFDAVVRWIAELQSRYGVSVQTLDVEPQSAAGTVNIRLSLVRAS